MPTQMDVAKAALAQTGTRSTITSFNDGSEEGLYLGILYGPLRDFLLAEGDYDFSLVAANTVPVTTPAGPWTGAYQYPTDALRIRQMVPSSFDVMDPRPVEWTISGQGGAGRVILTRVGMSRVIYTRAVGEGLWEPLFTEAFTRLLSSALLYALRNNVAPSKEKLSEAMSFAGIASLRDE